MKGFDLMISVTYLEMFLRPEDFFALLYWSACMSRISVAWMDRPVSSLLTVGRGRL